MPISRRLALSNDQLEELMHSAWNLRIATHGQDDRINLTPMWFGWGGGRIYLYGRGQKVVNLRRNPKCTIVVDRNERFPELQAAMFTGRAEVLENSDAENADPHLLQVRVQMGIKYHNGGHADPDKDPVPNNATAYGANGRWMVFTSEELVTWDNFKIAGLAKI